MNETLIPLALIPLAGIAVPVFLVPTVMAMRHVARKREWEHLERMKALEVGQPLPWSNGWPALAAIAIGALTPMSALFCAWMASLTTRFGEEAWTCAGFVGLGGVAGGTILATRLIGPRSRPAAKDRDANPLANGKPAHDPDAYDVVGRRG